MKLEALVLTNFRNLVDGEILFDSRITFFVGRNGQGKTNLLEAVYLLAYAKSFRHTKPPELKAWGKEIVPTLIRGRVTTEIGDKLISYLVEESSRKILINNKPVKRAADFFGQFRAIEFTPEDLLICKGAPAERRSFIDKILASYNSIFVETAQEYERALRNRNAVLRDLKRTTLRGTERGIERGTERAHAEKQLAPWNAVLAETGLAISKLRAKLVSELLPRFVAHYSALSGAESAELHYSSSWIDLTVEQILGRYREFLETDLRRGKTTQGAHLDELEISLKFGELLRVARSSASQGQARSVVLALKLAALELIHAKTGDLPVLLLDDVESELDPIRRAALHRLISNYGGQVFVSTTELQVASEFFGKASEKFRVIRIAAGQYQSSSELV